MELKFLPLAYASWDPRPEMICNRNPDHGTSAHGQCSQAWQPRCSHCFLIHCWSWSNYNPQCCYEICPCLEKIDLQTLWDSVGNNWKDVKISFFYAGTSWSISSQVWSKRILDWNFVSVTFLLQKLTKSGEKVCPNSLSCCSMQRSECHMPSHWIQPQSDEVAKRASTLPGRKLRPGRGSDLGLAAAALGINKRFGPILWGV